MSAANDAQGALAIWHDVREGSEAEFEGWYRDEHFPERLAVPGFRLGRRFEAVANSPRFFCYYLTDTPDVLTSGAYIARLNDPTPLTRAMMTGVFRNMNRTVCRRAWRSGPLRGAFAVTARFVAPPEEAAVRSLLATLANAPGTARCEFWAAAETGAGSAAEENLRGRDAKIAACALVETLRLADAERVAEKLGAAFSAAEIGAYRLLCELEPA